MSSYDDIKSHRAMVFDAVRNAAYADAIADLVGPGSIVLDLGAGLGIHGLLAAQAGAAKVYLVDPSPVLMTAQKVAAANGFSDRVTCIQSKIEDVELPEKVDVIISVLTGNLVLEEDLLPLLFMARDRHLKPGGSLIPDAAQIMLVPVDAPKLHERYVGRWSTGNCGLTFAAARSLAANSLHLVRVERADLKQLAEPLPAAALDFTQAKEAACRSTIQFTAVTDGVCHGLLGWFSMAVGKRRLSLAPGSEPTHWSQVFLPLDPPLDVWKNETIEVRLIRPEFGDWSWVVTHRGQSRLHSTFLSGQVSAATKRVHDAGKANGLSAEGRLLRLVLGLIECGTSRDELEAAVKREFSAHFATEKQLLKYVRNILVNYSE